MTTFGILIFNILVLLLGPFLFNRLEQKIPQKKFLLLALSAFLFLTFATRLLPQAFKLAGNGALWICFGVIFFYVVTDKILHKYHSSIDQVTWIMALTGVFTHAALDGIYLAIPPKNIAPWFFVALVSLHRLQDSFLVWSIFEQFVSKKVTWVLLGLVALIMSISFYLSEYFIVDIQSQLMFGYLQAAASAATAHIAWHFFKDAMSKKKHDHGTKHIH